MSLRRRAVERWETIRQGTRVALDLPKLVEFARTSPAQELARRARRAPGDLALAFREDRFTWGDVNEQTNRYANWFAGEGIGAGDVVALLMDNRPAYLFATMGLNRIGAVSALLNTNLRGRSLAHAIRVSRAAKILAGGESARAILEVAGELEDFSPEKELYVQHERGGGAGQGLRRINDEIGASSPDAPSEACTPSNRDTFCYIYTSGTTGLPKAAIVRNQRMLAAGAIAGRVMHRCGPGDVIYVVLPLYHSSAMCLGWGAAVATGAAVALRERFSASHFWNDVRRFDATSFLYVGELCRYLLNAEPRNGERDHRLRVAVGNGLRPDIWERFQERFAIPVIREFYGATEGNTAIVNYQGRPGMIGRLGRSCAVVRCEPSSGEILRNARGFCEEVEPGEIGLLVARISPLYRFDGYVDEEATRKKVVRDVFRRGDRYFDSGDLVQLHPGRWLSFADRVGDTFRWKGENVSTGEVEEVLGAMPGIREVNVYGVKVAHAEGRAGMAAIHVTGDFDLDAFSSFIREQLPGYQRPLFLRVLRGAMRMTATFKHPKVEYRREGFDPQLVEDPLHVLQGERYVPLDAETFERIQKGEVIPG